MTRMHTNHFLTYSGDVRRPGESERRRVGEGIVDAMTSAEQEFESLRPRSAKVGIAWLSGVWCCVLGALSWGIGMAAQLPAAEPARELTVMTYNIHHGEGTDGKLDLARIAQVIQREQPDLVALQEVDSQLSRSQWADQAAELARLTNLKSCYGPNLAIEQGLYGNAVLSRWLPISGEHVRLPNRDQGEQRGVIALKFSTADIAGGLTLLATHLDHRRDDGERIESAEVINRLVTSPDVGAAILAGDLNATWDSRPLNVLRGVWTRPHSTELLSSPAEAPRRQIDFILLRPETTWQPIDVRVLDESVASDHRPVVARLRWAGSETTWYQQESTWNGFPRYHFTVADRPAYVVVPPQAAAGNPWVWRTTFPDFHAEIDQELVRRGWHVAHLETSDLLGSPQAVREGEAFYRFLVEQRNLHRRVVVEGVSRGGLLAYNWTAQHPELVAAIYCDTPVCDIKSWPGGRGKGAGSPPDWQQCLQVFGLTEDQVANFQGSPIDHAAVLAKHRIPLLHIVSENDEIVPANENTYELRRRLEKAGHQLDVISLPQGTPESRGHHFTHPDPARVVDFVLLHAPAP